MLNITFLGTGTSQGIPVIGSNHPVCLSKNIKDKRLRTSVLISWKKFTYVIDCGPDFRQQILNTNCKRLDGIIFTHEHNDHVSGLDDVRPFYFLQGDINIYAKKRVIKALKKRFQYIFKKKNKYPGTPSVTIHKIRNEPFYLNNIKVIPIKAWHGTLKVFGYRFNTFAYLTDIKMIKKKEIVKLYGLDILVVNALRKEPHKTHFNLDEALHFIAKVKPKKAYLTHISHLMGFHNEVQQSLPKNVFLAYDNLQLTINDENE